MRIAKERFAAGLAAALLAWTPGAAGAEEEEHDAKVLGAAMKDVKVSLEAGIAASAREGTPLSAKFEVEDGHLQLSVYTMKGDGFSEVIVDHATGKVAKAEPITGGEDLEAARVQKVAMASAKRSLAEAAADAAKRNPGFRAVSVTPRVEGQRPVAAVTLLKGAGEWKTVTLPLDAGR